MTILACRNYFCWVLFGIIINFGGIHAQPVAKEPVCFPDSVCLIYPQYENKEQLRGIQPVGYRVSSAFSSASLSDSLVLGCYFVVPAGVFPADTLLVSYNLPKEFPAVQQIIISKSAGYIGFLEELLNVPFVLPPRRLQNGQHQTDLRLAVDCAELAIYGWRRQGYNIPYCGPKRIADYLVRTDELRPGTIIHFGHQVSVLYEDRGIIGELDSEDMVIHAYKDKAEIICLRDTDLLAGRYVLYEFMGE